MPPERRLIYALINNVNHFTLGQPSAAPTLQNSRRSPPKVKKAGAEQGQINRRRLGAVRRGEHDIWTLLNGRRHYQKGHQRMRTGPSYLAAFVCVVACTQSAAIEPTCVSPTCPATDARNDDGWTGQSAVERPMGLFKGSRPGCG